MERLDLVGEGRVVDERDACRSVMYDSVFGGNFASTSSQRDAMSRHTLGPVVALLDNRPNMVERVLVAELAEASVGGVEGRRARH